MPDIKINKFNGIVTFIEENDLTMETLRNAKNFRFERGFAYEFYPKVISETLPGLELGWEWETGISTLLNDDILQDSIIVNTYKVLVLSAKYYNATTGIYQRQLWFRDELDATWYSLTDDDLRTVMTQAIIPSSYLDTTIDAKIKFINDNGVLKIFLPHDSFWFGRLNRNLYLTTANTPINDYYFDRLSEPIIGTNLVRCATSNNITTLLDKCRIGVASKITSVTEAIVIAAKNYIKFDRNSYIEKDWRGDGKISSVSTVTATSTNDDILEGRAINPLSQNYPGGGTNEFVFYNLYEPNTTPVDIGYYEYRPKTPTKILIPEAFFNIYEPVSDSFTSIVYNKAANKVDIPYFRSDGAVLKYTQWFDINDNAGIPYGTYYAMTQEELLSNVFLEKTTVNDNTTFPERANAFADFIVTLTLDDITELVVDYRSVTCPITGKYGFKVDLTLPSDLNKRVSKLKVYMKLDTALDFTLQYETSLIGKQVPRFTDILITVLTDKGIALSQNIGFAIDVKKLQYYKVNTNFKDICYDRGYSLAIYNNQVYYCAIGGGKVQTDLFYEVNKITTPNDNSLNAILGVNGKYIVLNNDTTFVISMQEVDGIPTFEVQQSIEYGIKSKEDYTDIKGGVILHTNLGLFFCNGYETTLMSDAINDIIKANHTTGRIKYDATKHELYYWNTNKIDYYLYSFERKVWERYELDQTPNLQDIIFDNGNAIFIVTGGYHSVPRVTERQIVDTEILTGNKKTGAGTAIDPYKLYTKADLISVSSDLAAYYELGGDIDCTESSDTDIWVPIGTIADPFTGNFDGKGYKIKNLFCPNTSVASGVYGLFGKIESSGKVIQDIVIENPFFIIKNVNSGTVYLGVFAGVIGGGTIQNVRVVWTDPVAQADAIQAKYPSAWFTTAPNIAPETSTKLLGLFSIQNLSNMSNHYAGGFVGLNASIIKWCSVQNLYSTWNYQTSGVTQLGGFVGKASISSDIQECFATHVIGKIFKDGYNIVFGGFAGQIVASTTTRNCYSRISLISDTVDYYSAYAGFAGDINATITNCYVANIMPNALYNNGFAILSGGSVATCYWDNTTSLSPSTEANPKSTALMKTQSTFTGWDFVGAWVIDPLINDGYPYLLEHAPYTYPEDPIRYKTIYETIYDRVPGNGYELYKADSTGTNTVENNYFETIESNLQSPNTLKYVERIFIDYEGNGTLVVSMDGKEVILALLNSARSVDMLYIPLNDRIPFRKIKLKCISSIGLKIYNMHIDFEVTNYEEGRIYE